MRSATENSPSPLAPRSGRTAEYHQGQVRACIGRLPVSTQESNPDLVVRDNQGRVSTVRYDAVNAMLLNEFLKEHRKVEDLKKDFQATIAQQQKQIEALASIVQQVSDEVALSKPAPQLVANP